MDGPFSGSRKILVLTPPQTHKYNQKEDSHVTPLLEDGHLKLEKKNKQTQYRTDSFRSKDIMRHLSDIVRH